MHENFLKMLAAKKKARPMSDMEKKAKLQVLGDLASQADNAMSGKIKSLKKVTVASDSEEGLKKGLEKAEEALPTADEHLQDHEESLPENLSDLLDGEEESADFDESHPAPEDKGKALADMVDQHMSPKMDEAEESPEAIEAKIQELLRKKEVMSMKSRG